MILFEAWVLLTSRDGLPPKLAESSAEGQMRTPVCMTCSERPEPLNRTPKEPQAYHGVVREEVAMPRVETRYAHIVFEDSVPVISGTTMKVVQLVEEILASG